jgi:hypothetical protein
MQQYYILTQDHNIRDVFEFIKTHNLACEVHINRTRFWVPDGTVNTIFQLQYAHCCPPVDPKLDLTSGL